MAIHRSIRKCSTLVLEELLCLLPDADGLPILQLEKAGKKGIAECLGSLPRKQGRQMIDANDAEREVICLCRQLDRDCGSIKRCVDVVDRDGVVWVGGVARDVADHTKLTLGRSQ